MSTLETKTFELDNLRVSLGATSLATFTSPPQSKALTNALCFSPSLASLPARRT